MPEGSTKLYVGTENGGLNILDLRSRTFTRERIDPEDETSLNSASIYSMHLDDQGILWIGTNDGGMNKLDRRTGKYANFRPGAESGAEDTQAVPLGAGMAIRPGMRRPRSIPTGTLTPC